MCHLGPSVTIQDDSLLISKPLTPFAKSLFTNKVVFTGFQGSGSDYVFGEPLITSLQR